MRVALALSLLMALPAAAHDHAATQHAQTPAAAHPVQTTAAGAVYGTQWPDPAPDPLALDQVIAHPDALLGKSGAFSGRITQVCQKMGCWLVLSAESGQFVRVNMHDHAFGVPKDARGAAIVYGTLSEKTLSAKEIEHLRKEGAKVPAARELQIDANAVLIQHAG